MITKFFQHLTGELIKKEGSPDMNRNCLLPIVLNQTTNHKIAVLNR